MRERSAAGGSSGGELTMVTVGAVRRGVVNVVMRGARWLLLLLKGEEEWWEWVSRQQSARRANVPDGESVRGVGRCMCQVVLS